MSFEKFKSEEEIQEKLRLKEILRIKLQSIYDELTTEFSQINIAHEGSQFTELEVRLSELSPRVENYIHIHAGHEIMGSVSDNTATPEEVKEYGELLEQKAQNYLSMANKIKEL